MLKHYAPQIRRITVCAATALAISLPSIASAGIFDKAISTTQGAVVHLSNVAKKVERKRKQQQAKMFKHVSENLPGVELVELVKQLDLKEQLQNTIALMQQMNADYEQFSGGGSGCKAECKAFRTELKATFEDFLLLIEEVPILNDKPGLFENVARVAELIDVVPPRALYLMWQALDAQMDQLRSAADNIRFLLAALPPLDAVSDVASYAKMAGSVTADSPICVWANQSDQPFVELVQAELEHTTWLLNTVEGFIPDVEVKAEAGAEAGAAVANVTGAAGVGAKPTDAVKIALKVVATIPEVINWAIKLNTLRARAVCAGAKFVAK